MCCAHYLQQVAGPACPEGRKESTGGSVLCCPGGVGEGGARTRGQEVPPPGEMAGVAV